MPTYEYECTHCGYNFEVFQKITDKPLDNCPKCKYNNKVKRLIGAGSGIIFSRSWRDSAKAEKGSGFYAADYRKKTKTEPAEAKDNTCHRTKKECDACEQK